MSSHKKEKLELVLPEAKDSQILFDQFVKIRCDTLVFKDLNLQHKHYTLLPRADAVNVLAMTPDRKFVLTREYRHSTGKVLLGCPGGYIDGHETPLDAARRELMEETGYAAEAFEVMGSAFPYPGLSSQKIIFVRGLNARHVADPQLEQSEVIQTVIKSHKELREEISQDAELDGILCSALFFWSIF